MAREFEFKQLLRAYRSGILSESMFEAEMAALENGDQGTNGHASNGAGFKAFGKTYKSERAAIISFLDKVRAGEAGGAEAFNAWVKACKTECIYTGLQMIAEREAYHSRVFGKRLAELGGEERAGATEEGRKLTALLGSTEIPDNEKFLRLTSNRSNPEDGSQPIRDFAALICEDMSTKEALRLFAEDELSTAKWIWDTCAALNPSASATKAEPMAKSMSGSKSMSAKSTPAAKSMNGAKSASAMKSAGASKSKSMSSSAARH
jgi:hypothetical protein